MDRVNELVMRYKELRIDIDRMWGDCKLLTEKLDNHISKHKEHAEGGDPCPNENSDI